jgi:ferredoxin
MKNIIYYFTGRGNSLRVANELAKRLGDTETRFMRMEEGTIGTSVERIGIITPVIDFGIPSYVKRFIKSMNCSGTKPYVFAIVTCGGMPCASSLQLKKCLKRQGFEPDSDFLFKFGLEQYTDNAWNKMMDEMASVIQAKTVKPFVGIPLKDRLLTALANPLARMMIPGDDRKFHVNESCNGCGICKKICLVDNIKIIDKKPVWLHKCEQCAACFGWCPKKAIYGTNLAAKTHYTNPYVTLSQILNEQQVGGKKECS